MMMVVHPTVTIISYHYYYLLYLLRNHFLLTFPTLSTTVVERRVLSRRLLWVVAPSTRPFPWTEPWRKTFYLLLSTPGPGLQAMAPHPQLQHGGRG